MRDDDLVCKRYAGGRLGLLCGMWNTTVEMANSVSLFVQEPSVVHGAFPALLTLGEQAAASRESEEGSVKDVSGSLRQLLRVRMRTVVNTLRCLSHCHCSHAHVFRPWLSPRHLGWSSWWELRWYGMGLLLL
jgi:hypothetical protein